jgi:hypothetical protein
LYKETGDETVLIYVMFLMTLATLLLITDSGHGTSFSPQLFEFVSHHQDHVNDCVRVPGMIEAFDEVETLRRTLVRETRKGPFTRYTKRKRLTPDLANLTIFVQHLKKKVLERRMFIHE